MSTESVESVKRLKAELEEMHGKIEIAETNAIYWEEKFKGRWPCVGDDEEKQKLRDIIRERDDELHAALAMLADKKAMLKSAKGEAK